MKTKLVVGDADAIIAQANPEDLNHQQAIAIAQKLIDLGVNVIYPATAVAEAVTHIQRVLSSRATAYGTAQLFLDPAAQIIEVNKQTLANALKYFSPTTSKKNTLFDCIVAATAEEYKADAIFSFDDFYTKKGFKLANELGSSVISTHNRVQPMKHMKHRLFLGIGIGKPLQKQIAAWQKTLPPLPLRSLSPENLHLTLIPPWYSENPEETASLLRSSLPNLNLKLRLRLRLTSVSYGPDPRRPRLIWAKGSTPKELKEIKTRLEKCLGQKGENRPFSLHLTLARFPPKRFSEFKIKTLHEKISWQQEVTTLTLYESHLKPTGAEYQKLAEIPLV